MNRIDTQSRNKLMFREWLEGKYPTLKTLAAAHGLATSTTCEVLKNVARDLFHELYGMPIYYTGLDRPELPSEVRRPLYRWWWLRALNGDLERIEDQPLFEYAHVSLRAHGQSWPEMYKRAWLTIHGWEVCGIDQNRALIKRRIPGRVRVSPNFPLQLP